MIHKSSVIDPKAKIGKDVKVGPFCFVGPKAQLEDQIYFVEQLLIIQMSMKKYP